MRPLLRAGMLFLERLAESECRARKQAHVWRRLIALNALLDTVDRPVAQRFTAGEPFISQALHVGCRFQVGQFCPCTSDILESARSECTVGVISLPIQ